MLRSSFHFPYLVRFLLTPRPKQFSTMLVAHKHEILTPQRRHSTHRRSSSSDGSRLWPSVKARSTAPRRELRLACACSSGASGMDWAVVKEKKLTPMATPTARSFVIHSSLVVGDLNSDVNRSAIHLAGRSVNWWGFERRWNTDALRHRKRFRFELTGDQPHPAEVDDAT